MQTVYSITRYFLSNIFWRLLFGELGLSSAAGPARDLTNSGPVALESQRQLADSADDRASEITRYQDSKSVKELDPGEHILRIRLHERNLYSSSGHFLNPTEDDVDCVICAGVKISACLGKDHWLSVTYVQNS